MDAMKEALKRKMLEAKGKGSPVPDQEIAPGGEIEGDALVDEKKLKEENDLAPEIEDEGEDQAMLGAELGEQDLLKQILAALSDRSPTAGRGPNGLAERAAMGARGKLDSMKKA